MDPSLVAGAGSSQSESTVLEATDQADEILQQPVRNIEKYREKYREWDSLKPTPFRRASPNIRT